MSGILAFAAGLQMPLGDSDWTKYVDPSPVLSARAGVVEGLLSGMLSVDFIPESLTSQQTRPANFDTGASGYRFRVLAHGGIEKKVGDKLTVTGRVGLGVDIVHGSYDYTLLGTRFSGSNSDAGLAVEFGGGAWWDVGSVQVGGEIALPIGHHDSPAQNGSIGFVWTSYDLDLLVGVRFLSL